MEETLQHGTDQQAPGAKQWAFGADQFELVMACPCCMPVSLQSRPTSMVMMLNRITLHCGTCGQTYLCTLAGYPG